MIGMPSYPMKYVYPPPCCLDHVSIRYNSFHNSTMNLVQMISTLNSVMILTNSRSSSFLTCHYSACMKSLTQYSWSFYFIRYYRSFKICLWIFQHNMSTYCIINEPLSDLPPLSPTFSNRPFSFWLSNECTPIHMEGENLRLSCLVFISLYLS